MSFKDVVLLILRLLKCSVRTELKTYFSTLFPSDLIVNWVSDAAFCKARQKIKAKFFQDLSEFITQYFYRTTKAEQWFGYRLLAIDGSCLNLPPSKELLEEFKEHHTNSIGTKIPMARISILSDVLNSLTIDAQIDSFKISEQEFLERQLPFVKITDLLTADSNYAHLRILKVLVERKINYCMRINKSSNFIKNFLASGEKDAILTWCPSQKTKENCRKHNVSIEPLTVRLIRIDLSDNETEVLITSLLSQEDYSYEVMGDLYNKRWAVEEEIKKMTQRVLIEFFSSVKVNGVKQDFYANICLLNIVTLLAEPTKKKVKKASSGNKYEQQINYTAAIGDVREKIVLLFERSYKKVNTIIISLWESFMFNTNPIRPGRKFKRDARKKGARNKCYMQYKPAW